MAKVRDFSQKPLTYSADMMFPYPWNHPVPDNYYKAGIVYEKPLTTEQREQAQEILTQLRTLPRFLASRFERTYQKKTRTEGINKGQAYLYFDFYQTLWPRLVVTQNRYQIQFGQCPPEVYLITPNIEQINYLPDLSTRSMKRLAKHIASGFFNLYQQRCDALVTHRKGNREVIFNVLEQSVIYGELAELSLLLHVTPSHYQTYQKYGFLKLKQIYAAISRLASADFWERRLKEHKTRWLESLAIAAMDVNCNKHPYVSKRGVKAVLSQKLNNIQYLKTMDIEDEKTLERFDLYEKVEKSISNPANRYNELMAMTRGIENVACQLGDIGLFLTLTCPSKYHATSKIRVGKKHANKKQDKYKAIPNKKWLKTQTGTPSDAARTPKDAQRYIAHVWQLIRTALNDESIPFYGVRTVEPHHDSTPHWHILLFTSPRNKARVIEIFEQKALAEDGNETGAEEHRFKCEDMEKGKATGYIAKYIAKCIPGDHKGTEALKKAVDFETGLNIHPDSPDETPAPDRIAAWASIWRIRQFQSFGIPPKGVYRECRRLRGLGKKNITDDLGDVAEKVRAAADKGKFDDYILAQGGVCIPADELTLRTARKVADTPNEYGEYRSKVIGLYSPLDASRPVLNTYPKKYRIVKKKTDENDNTKKGFLPLGRAIGAPRSTVNNYRSALSDDTETPSIWEGEPLTKAQIALLEEGYLTQKTENAPPTSTPLMTDEPKRQISRPEFTEKERGLRQDVAAFFENQEIDVPDVIIDRFIQGMRIKGDIHTYWFDDQRIQQRFNHQGETPTNTDINTQKQAERQKHADKVAAVLARVNQPKKG